MTTHVKAKDGTKLMPTTNIKKVRKLLRSGRAEICGHNPFTIQLKYEIESAKTQDVEFKEDTGYEHIGVSLTSQKHEYVSEQRDTLKDEVERHTACRKYRRTRRNRKRHRAARFDNRKASKPKGWAAPSISNKKNLHIQVFDRLYKATPIKRAVIELAQFDAQVLKAIEEGKPVPKGLDYQHGEQYGYDTLREAVFARDNYTCVCCKKNAIENNLILTMHHIGYWKKDRTNRMSNLATVCTKCHTHKNHKPGGKLYGKEPITKSFKAETFMNIIKAQIVNEFRTRYPDVEVVVTFGAITKRTRNDLNIEKSHADDAYCMGSFRPKHRAKTKYYQKRRRNNRVLEKFYDAKVIDVRGYKETEKLHHKNKKKRMKIKPKKGADLSCGRTNRREPRMGSKNERIYRGDKKSAGHRSIRKKRYKIQPGTVFLYKGKKYVSGGVQHYGEYVTSKGLKKAVKVEDIKVVKHSGGWLEVNKPKQKTAKKSKSTKKKAKATSKKN